MHVVNVLLVALATGCSWFASLPDIRLDGDTVREIAEYLGVDEATLQFELRCTAVDEVATCDVVGSTSVIPGELVQRITQDIGTDVLSGRDVGVRCTVVVADSSATTCEVDVGNGWQEVPVDGIGGDPGDGVGDAPGVGVPPVTPPERDRDRSGKRGGADKQRRGSDDRAGGDRSRGGDADRAKRDDDRAGRGGPPERDDRGPGKNKGDGERSRDREGDRGP